METKICTKCKKEKPIKEYWTGGQQQCKDCCNEQRRNKRKNDIDYAEKLRETSRNKWNRNKSKYNSRRNMLRKTDIEFRKKYLEAQKKTYYKHHEERKRKLRERPKEKKKEDNKKYRKRHPERILIYEQSERGKSRRKKYYKTPKAKILWAKANAKKRELGFCYKPTFPNELDEPFEWHHYNHTNEDVVAIPKDIHQLYIMGKDSKKHREMLLPIVQQLYPKII